MLIQHAQSFTGLDPRCLNPFCYVASSLKASDSYFAISFLLEREAAPVFLYRTFTPKVALGSVIKA